MKLRSAKEIRFRLLQEFQNFVFYLNPPSPGILDVGSPRLLPDPAPIVERLRDTDYAREVIQLAEHVLEHRIPLFNRFIDYGREIPWRRDVEHGIETGLDYFRRIPYLDMQQAGDHKRIWELSRHQHLILLAQAWRFTGRPEFVAELNAQLTSWMEQNPVQRGIHWTSALEVGFRALSWTWIWHLAGDQLTDRATFLKVLFQHGRHLEYNLSYYFSPNTHLLGEAVALHALGALFPEFPHAERWREIGDTVVKAELTNQVNADGSHFERSSYYHVYALDMFVFHRILSGPDQHYDRRLNEMADYLLHLSAGDHPLPFFGDDDGGRMFHPYGDRQRFSRGCLATCAALLQRTELLRSPEDLQEQSAWWLGASVLDLQPAPAPVLSSRRFPDSGVTVMRRDSETVMMLGGGRVWGRGGHSHADALSVVAFADGREILIDPATYTYISEPEWRDRFRGTAAHNTVAIDELSQAIPLGPFAWTDFPEVEVREWDASRNFVDAECRYQGFSHRRQMLWEGGIVWIVDTIQGRPGPHRIRQLWHAGGEVEESSLGKFRIGAAQLFLAGGQNVNVTKGGLLGWRSRVLTVREQATVICAEVHAELPVVLAAALCFDDPLADRLEAQRDGDGVLLSLGSFQARFQP